MAKDPESRRSSSMEDILSAIREIITTDEPAAACDKAPGGTPAKKARDGAARPAQMGSAAAQADTSHVEMLQAGVFQTEIPRTEIPQVEISRIGTLAKTLRPPNPPNLPNPDEAAIASAVRAMALDARAPTKGRSAPPDAAQFRAKSAPLPKINPEIGMAAEAMPEEVMPDSDLAAPEDFTDAFAAESYEGDFDLAIADAFPNHLGHAEEGRAETVGEPEIVGAAALAGVSHDQAELPAFGASDFKEESETDLDEETPEEANVWEFAAGEDAETGSARGKDHGDVAEGDSQPETEEVEAARASEIAIPVEPVAESQDVLDSAFGAVPVAAGAEESEDFLELTDMIELEEAGETREAPAAPLGECESTMLSVDAEEAAALAFADLNATLDDAFDLSPERVEALAAETMAPMLREWMDEHLSTLVEKVVEAEVQRIALRALSRRLTKK